MPTAGSNERPWPGWWRSALGRRHAATFALLVSLPLLAYAAWSAAQVYRQQRDALAAVQTAQADAAAARIQQFLREIELQLTWLTALPWTPDAAPQRRLDALRALRVLRARTRRETEEQGAQRGDGGALHGGGAGAAAQGSVDPRGGARALAPSTWTTPRPPWEPPPYSP